MFCLRNAGFRDHAAMSLLVTGLAIARQAHAGTDATVNLGTGQTLDGGFVNMDLGNQRVWGQRRLGGGIGVS